MSAAKLDQSLDDILSQTRRNNKSRAGGRRARGGKQNAPAAPVGGVKKNTKPAKANKPIPTGPSGGNSDSKIIVSNLPLDIDEQQMKDYCTKAIGPVKKVIMTYGPNGQSRGICTVIFAKADSAVKAVKQLDGIEIDRRPMKVEVILSAKDAPAVPTPKSLADRISQPKKEKAQPKPATAAKVSGNRGRGNKRGGRAGRGGSARGPKKTVEELDAEMADYFVPAPDKDGNDDAMVTNGGTTQATGGDVGMDDEML